MENYSIETHLDKIIHKVNREDYKDYVLNAEKYMRNHWQYHNHLTRQNHQHRIKYTAKFCCGNTLEVGCANGFSTKTMKDANKNAKFFGLELTEWGYAKALSNYGTEITFYQGLGEDMPFENNKFDTVVLPEIIEHCKEPRVLADEAWRVAKQRLIITTPTKHHNDPDHKRFFSIEKMNEFLKPYGTAIFNGLTKSGKIVTKKDEIYFQIVYIDKK
jgi:2-polyprenyl-3-methyl-5-hydroxy-6-metoxy-1,4-benzoquinol methylase